MAKELWKGNEAIGEAAIKAGCDGFFGYPITPQSEVPEYMSLHMPQNGRVFVQSESEVSAINMVYGGAAAGKRVMTSSSSLGISLKQEGMSYLAAAELPCVVVNMMRGGPGLGTIQPAQGDYLQATRGGGSGDYRNVVFAPCNVQELVDYVQEAFDVADLYRNPVVVLADGLIGQMMEPIEWHEIKHRDLPSKKDWAVEGRKGAAKPHNVAATFQGPEDGDFQGKRLAKKFAEMEKNELRWEEYMIDDAEIIFTAYGTPARICRTAVDKLRAEGIKAGLFRPQIVWPFPYARLRELALSDQVKCFVDVEMSSLGQMLDDVKIAVREDKPVAFYERSGGVIPSIEEVMDAAKNIYKEVK